MSDSQLSCSYCKKEYQPFKTLKGINSKLCQPCRENQQKAEEKRKGRVRNYQAEAKRNLENNWKSFLSKSVERREKEINLTKEQYFELIQKKCTYCNYYNENEINGIDRVDNTKGYLLENCVTACKHCNRIKHILHPVFFIGKAGLICKFQDSILDVSERNEFYKKWSVYIHKVPTPHIYVKRITEEKRGLEYSLTKEQYEELIYKPCYLCGFKNTVGNGLDRQDNSIGYIYENVLTCCSTCNMMKSFYNKDDFIGQMRKIAEVKEYPEEWNKIPCNGFHMGASKTEKESVAKEKQWRAVSIYKAVKSDTLDEFKKKTIETTGWSEEIYEEKTAPIFESTRVEPFEKAEGALKKLVEVIRAQRSKNVGSK